MLYALLALVSLALTVGGFYLYFGDRGSNVLYLVLAIVFMLATVAFGGLFLSSRVNKTEDIHITE